ncbi:YggN family protein [Vibrio sagamiensis]|uniref:Chemotaxis protein n=1 Tax=Vibrio sagamiensis NBRC 104589 TaxID=1219064 RepID=A0A511Q9T6_9VIBR|nr:YggN family protein [Vibrio sagamiensis]PNQ71935.1 DUF2884 domain-containing protein [Vibrio agarivorans]GEM74051.1 chemotaxis protein [Vibrio sagamiensis NBRC 104589]
MNKLLPLSLLMFSASGLTAQCHVDIKNEVRLDGQALEITKTNGEKVRVDNNDDLLIDGKLITLNESQKEAIKSYREKLNSYIPQAKHLADESLALANDIIDDIAQSIDSPAAFDNVKVAANKFFKDVEARYFKDGDFILPAESFDSMMQSWSKDLEKAQALFSSEFLGSAFEALSVKMKEDGGLNLTELSKSLSSLQAKVEQRLSEHSKEMEQKAKSLCDSLDGIAEQEQELHKKIPELKNYQVFII